MAAGEDDQQFCLRWNNHQSTLISVFDTLLEKGIHVDCTLAAEGRTLKAHKVVLSACSPYFEAVLSQQYDKHPIIILKDVKFAELRAMMDYMYRGEVNISQDQLGALLKAAESLQIKGLSDNKPPPSTPPATSPSIKVRSTRASPVEEEVSRDGSVSPSRRKRKRHHNSLSPVTENPRPMTPPATLTNCFDSQNDDSQNKIKIQDAIDTPAILTKTENNIDTTIEPKSEFSFEGNEDSVEDLTVDEEADSDGEQTGPGSSQPNADGSVQGFAWQIDRSHDDVTAAQDGQRDSQGVQASLELASLRNIPPMPIFDAATLASTNFNLIQDSLSQNNNVITKEEPDFKHFQKVEADSDGEFDDLDDILLPDETEVFGTSCTPVLKEESPVTRMGRRMGRGHNPQFECRHCGKRYRWKSTLRRHESVECGGKAPSHACPYCPYRAKQRGNLGVHIRKHHNTEWTQYATTKLRKAKKEDESVKF